MFTVYFSCFRTFRTQWDVLILTGWRSRAVTGCLVERQDWWTAGDTGPKCSDPTAVAAAGSITRSLQYHKHKLTATHWEQTEDKCKRFDQPLPSCWWSDLRVWSDCGSSVRRRLDCAGFPSDKSCKNVNIEDRATKKRPQDRKWA